MKLHVVLVRTEYASNIGSTARAMANMGADRLILVDPACALDDRAKEMAAGAQQKLKSLTSYVSWSAFFQGEDDGLRLAFSRRAGRNRKIFEFKNKLDEFTRTFAELPEIWYLVFGPEADGLDSEDLGLMNLAVHLPVYGDFASLNLSQAVLLALFMIRQKMPPENLPAQIKGKQVTMHRPFYFPDELIKQWLTAMGFDIRARRKSAYLTLRRLLMQNMPTRHEMQVLDAILQQNVRKLLEKGSNPSIGFAAKDLADDLGDVTR